MKPTVDVRFTGMSPSDSLEHTIREHADKLARFHPDPFTLHVVVDQPHQRHHQGNVFSVRLDARVRGREIVVNHAGAGSHPAHTDPYLAVNDAFHAMRRKLQEDARVRRGDVKAHLAPAQGVVSELSPEDGTGRLVTPDDRDLAFTRAAVSGGGFDDLHVGSVVDFQEDPNALQPRAHVVRPHHHAGASPEA